MVLVAGDSASCLVEVGLDRQMAEMIVAAGPAGINSVDLFRRLHLNNKRNASRWGRG